MLGPDITEQRSWSHSHAGQLGPFQCVQMSQECAELGTTSLLPSPPPTPHPLICFAQALSRPHPLYPLSFISLREGLLSVVPPVPCHSLAPSQTSEEVTEGRSSSPSADPMG